MPALAHGSEAWKTRPGVRAVVVDDHGRLLVLKRPDTSDFWPGTWNLPGGGQDPGEDALTGAIRELREETGLTADYTGISMPFFFPGGKGKAFLFRSPSARQAFAPREVSEARWVYPDELPEPLFPTTAEIVRGLAGTGRSPMKGLELTAKRRFLEHWAGQAVAPWLKAMTLELAAKLIGGDRLEKSLTPADPEWAKVVALFKANEKTDKARVKLIHDKLDTDGLGEKAFLKVLERSIKMGRAEAARAILIDAKAGKLPEGKQGYKKKSLEALTVIARRHLKLVKATTEKRLAAIAGVPEAADVHTMLAKVYDTYRSDLIGQNLVAEGYVNGVCDVLKDHGYNTVYARTMADDRVCPACKHFETTPELARMTIRQFLKRFPLHPKCRCWPSPSPTAAPAPLNWKAPRAKIVKGLFGMQTTMAVLRDLVGDVSPDLVKAIDWTPTPDQLGTALDVLGVGDRLQKALTPEEKAAIAKQIASKRNRVGGKFAAGKVTPEKAKGGKKKAAVAPPAGKAKKMAGATASDLMNQAKAKVKAGEDKAIAGGGGKKPPKGGAAATFGGSEPGKGGGNGAGGQGAKVNTTAPDHLIQSGAALLEQLRNSEPGSPEHGHLLTQYNAIRTSIQTWNKTKGATATPDAGQEYKSTTKMPKPPAFVTGGESKLKTPKQFEIAASQAETKEDATELAHYFEVYSHTQGHAGAQWDAAWNEIKGAMKSLPGKAQLAAGTDAKGKPLPAAPKPLQQGLEAAKAKEEYEGHLDQLHEHQKALWKVGATGKEKMAAQKAHIEKLEAIADATGKKPSEILADASAHAMKKREAEATEFKAAEPAAAEKKPAAKKDAPKPEGTPSKPAQTPKKEAKTDGPSEAPPKAGKPAQEPAAGSSGPDPDEPGKSAPAGDAKGGEPAGKQPGSEEDAGAQGGASGEDSGKTDGPPAGEGGGSAPDDVKPEEKKPEPQKPAGGKLDVMKLLQGAVNVLKQVNAEKDQENLK